MFTSSHISRVNNIGIFYRCVWFPTFTLVVGEEGHEMSYFRKRMTICPMAFRAKT